jgi:hypothetical protein
MNSLNPVYLSIINFVDILRQLIYLFLNFSTFCIELKCSLSSDFFLALIYFSHSEVNTSLYSTVVLWSDFGRISQQILGFQIDHEFRLCQT